MRKILMLTDFSEASINAMKYAIQLYAEYNCSFFVLHVKKADESIMIDLYTKPTETIYSSIFKETKKKLNKLISVLEEEFTNENFSYVPLVDYDALSTSVNQILKTKKIDLIVMGSNGVTGAKEVIFGSNTMKVIRHVKANILVIPEGFAYNKPKKALLALDAFDSVKGGSMKRLIRFLDVHKMDLDVVRFNPVSKNEARMDDLESLNMHLSKERFAYSIICDVPIHFAVDTLSQTGNVDILGLFVQDEGFLERLVIGSPTTEISNKNRLPLLIFRF